MGVDNIDPNIPPLVIVNVPPSISSRVIFPSLALVANLLISDSISLKVINSAFLKTGTINPFGALTAIPISE